MKDGGPRDQERSDFCVVFTVSLCALGPKNVHMFSFSNHASLKLGIHVLRGYLRLTCEYELHILPNTKVSAAREHGKNYIKLRPSLICHLLRNRLLAFVNWMRKSFRT